MLNKYNILNGAKHFSLGLFQNYLVFIPNKKCIKYSNGTIQIYSWKSNGMSEESIEIITKSNSLFAPDVMFNGHCLINNNISIPKKVINIYFSYILNHWPRGFTLVNCLFGSVKLTKNANPDKYVYTGYGIGFDLRSKFSLPCFVISLHYNASNSFLFVNATKIKQKTLK